jgi:pimeloyl-ACP methyl ester carboxylesterase
MEPLMQLLGTHFRVIAPDTPGYGQSASMQQAPETIEGYLPFIEQLVAHLQADRIFLYGSATGAQLAIGYALAHPEKVSHLFLDNVAHFEKDARNQLLQQYFISLEPENDGSHLTRLQQMVEQSFLFFPWFSTHAENRIADSLPPAAVIQQLVEDFLIAGTDYARAYRAAFMHERAEKVQQLKVPTLIFRWQGSPILRYMDQLLAFSLPDCVRVVPTPAAIAERRSIMQQEILLTKTE